MLKLSIALTIAFFSLTPSTFVSAHTADPLFVMMLGSWEGQGMRTQQASGHKISIVARTETTLQSDQLISKSEITETPVDTNGAPLGPSRTYGREYWVRALAGDQYEFGIGSGAHEKVFSIGVFNQNILEVEQSVGGSSPYIVHSRTRFEDEVRDYTEVVSQNGKRLSQTLIQYRRLR